MSDWLRSMLVAILTALALVSCSEATALAAGPNVRGERQRAAAAYDSGVDAYERGDHAVAARRFLEADDLAPNEDALRNALVAAKRSEDPALVREVAERILARPHESGALVSAARTALTALPPERPVDVISSAVPATPPPASPPLSTATAVSPRPLPAPHVDVKRHESTRAWARPVFYTGVGVTAVLTGLTIWSGLDALAARRDLPTQADNDSVTRRAHRTDVLLAGSLLAAAGTLYVGVRWVDWAGGAKPVQVAAQLSPTHAIVALRGSF